MMSCNHSSAVSSPAAGSVPKHPCSTSSTGPSAPLFWWGFNVVWIDRLNGCCADICLLPCRWGGAEGRMLNLNMHNWVYVVNALHLPLRAATHWTPSVWRILGIQLVENWPSGSTKCPAETPFAMTCLCFRPLKWYWHWLIHTGFL